MTSSNKVTCNFSAWIQSMPRAGTTAELRHAGESLANMRYEQYLMQEVLRLSARGIEARTSRQSVVASVVITPSISRFDIQTSSMRFSRWAEPSSSMSAFQHF